MDGGSTDNCGIASGVPDITSFNCTDLGANIVTLTITDVAGNTDYQITIFFRMFLSITQCIRGNDIKLNMMTIHPEVTSYQRNQF